MCIFSVRFDQLLKQILHIFSSFLVKTVKKKFHLQWDFCEENQIDEAQLEEDEEDRQDPYQVHGPHHRVEGLQQGRE